MSEKDWADLERAWKTIPVEGAQALGVIKAQRRRDGLRRLYDITEIVIAVIAVPFSIWLMTIDRPLMLETGILCLVFTVAICGLSIWARAVPKPRADDAVATALAVAVRRARVGVRMGLATIWGVCVGLLLYSLYAFYLTLTPGIPNVPARAFGIVFGIENAWLAFVLAIALLYHRSRARELARLEALEAALRQD